MLVRSLSILLSFLATLNSISQSNYSFHLLSEDKEPISFASVYCTKTKTGGYTDLEGKIKLYKLYSTDTLVLRCMGYKEEIIKVSDISDTLILIKEINQLNEFVVKSSFERENYGITRKTFFKSSSQSGYVGYREGIILSVEKKSQLESIELFITKNVDSSRTKFLLLIYSINDSSNLPEKSILSRKIFFNTSSIGWSKINLDSHNIQTNGRIFIGVETVPNFDLDDAPNNFTFTEKPHSKYGFISYYFKASSLTWVHGHTGYEYNIGFDENGLGAHNNFPRIKATFKK